LLCGLRCPPESLNSELLSFSGKRSAASKFFPAIGMLRCASGFQKMSPDPLPDILGHYTQVDEDSRLRQGWFQLELARTQELILKRIKPAPALVLDVGGGSGVYSAWLASLGYEVHLLDPVPKHIDQARALSARQQKPIASMRVGDARHLEESTGSFDAVLLLGPLYHLTERKDRVTSLEEAFRVLRPGGLVFAAAISRFASLFDSLRNGFFEEPLFAPILERDLAEGQHRNETGNPQYFTTAFFHRPGELSRELIAGGFRVEEVAAIEGPGWLAQDFDDLWTDRALRARLLESIRKVEHEPSILGSSPHILAVGRK
jgi:SAM-dependent methyltransferase